MKTGNKIIAIFLLVMLLGCGAKKSVTPDDLIDKEWTLTSCNVNGTEVDPGQEPAVLLFTDSVNVGGSSGCNRIIGNYELKDDTLTVNIIGTTRMACPDMEFESKYLGIMQNPMSVRIEDDGSRMVLENSAAGIDLTYELPVKSAGK